MVGILPKGCSSRQQKQRDLSGWRGRGYIGRMSFPRILVLTLMAVLSACLTAASANDRIRAVPRVLSSDEPYRTQLGECEVLGIMELRWSERWFGGFSGMMLDGDRLVAVNDVGHWMRLRLDLDAEGRPRGVSDAELTSLGGLDGTKEDGDAEDIAATSEGLVVSFERRHRLLLYPDGLSGKPRALSAPQGFTRSPDNGGVEALAWLGDDRLLMIAEEGEGDVSPAWIGRSGAWQRLSYRRHGRFHPSGATTLPNGDVLVLERSFTWLGGMGMRLVRLKAETIRPGAVLDGDELAVLQPPLLVDNFEALAVRRRASDGRIVAYLLSDDNFNPIQATLLMAVLLPL